MHKGVRVALVFVVLAFSLFQALFLLYEASYPAEKVQGNLAQGTISLCIGYPPSITHVCNEFINQSTSVADNTLHCQMTAVSMANASLKVNFTYTPFVVPGLSFSMNSSGFMTIWGNQTGVGRYLVPITIEDDALQCKFSRHYDYYFNISDINDPPYLRANMPNKAVVAGTSIAPYFLTDYFRDPDPGDTFTYSVTNSSFTISINPITSQVVIAAPTTLCTQQTVMFTATDSGNLSANSNAVTIESTCPETTPSGGGGGGSSINCEPDWQCKDWSRCFANGTRFRVCVDMHGCDPYNLKQDFWENCMYVPTCYDGIQNQGERGIDCGGPCPACSPSEIVKKPPIPTCDDGVKNQGELGVDCGGPCPICKQIEVPGLLPEKYNDSLLTASIIIVIVLGALMMTYLVFRKEIKASFAKFVWWFTRRRRKQVLLTDEQKKELLDSLRIIETKLRKGESQIKTSDKTFQDLLKLNRTYMNYALNLPFTFYDEELTKGLAVVKNANLVNALRNFVSRQTQIEGGSAALSRQYALYYMQELRQLVLNTSNYDKNDYSFLAKEVPVSGIPMEQGTALLYNSTLALAFGNVDAAKNNYLQLLGIYEMLNDAEKAKVYSEVAKLFSYVSYSISWVEKT